MVMLRMILTSLLLVVFGFPLVWSADLTGRVINSETRGLIRDVNVHILETGQIVSSDRNGRFEIRNLKGGRYHLFATHVSFDTSDTMTIDLSETQELDIYLIPAPWVLNDVVITGTRSPHLLKDVPVHTEVITSRDFQRTGATSVDEALQSSIGIIVSEDLSGQGAAIRGVEGDRVLVLIDGERAVGRVRGSLDLGQFSLSNVEKIEVVKGTGSTLYGSDAIGGVINIITKKPGVTGGHADLYFDGGSHTSLNPSTSLEYGNQNRGLTLGAKYFATDGFDLDKTDLHTDGIEKIRRLNVDSKFRQRLSEKWSTTASGRYMRETKEWIESEPLDEFFYVAYNDDETNSRYDGSLSFDYLSGDRYSMKFRALASRYDHLWRKVTLDNVYWIDTADTEDQYYEASYTSNYVIGDNHVATYGLDYSRQDLVSTEIVEDAEPSKTWDGYFQYEYSPHSNWNILPGIRYEHHNAFGGQVNPSINVMFKPNDGLKLRGYVGRGFRAPSMKQLYFIFDHSAWGYIVYGGNVPLPPDVNVDAGKFKELHEETSINSAVSMELSYGTIGLHRLTYFYNDLNGLIDFIPIDSNEIYRNGIYMYQNIENSITQGIEWESRVRLSSSFDLSFSYNYLYSRNLDTGFKLFNRPDHTVKMYMTSYFERPGFGLSLWGDYQSKKLWIAREDTGGSDPERARYAPHRTTINANLFKRFPGGLEVFVRGENLLNETNVNFHYWPGLEFFAGFKYRLNIDS